MPNESLQTWTYRVLRYLPNLERDEWVNVGVLLYDAGGKRLKARLIEDEADFRRVRRLHPNADENLLRALPGDFDAQIAAQRDDPGAYLAKLDETLANALQLGPRKGLEAADFDAELDRLYDEQVAAPRTATRAGQWLANARGYIRARAREIFRRAGILERMAKGIPAAEFTYPGDPLRLDYGYRRNGTRGFAQALSLARDVGQAKVLAYTAERIRAKAISAEFTAITEAEPQRESARHQFVRILLEEQNIEVVPLARLEAWANRLRPELGGRAL